MSVFYKKIAVVFALIALGLSALSTASGDEAADFAKGVEALEARDYDSAFKILHPLAEQGHAGAQSFVGLMYETGEGVEQDVLYAYMWFDLAAANGFESAVKFRRWLAQSSMTPAQIDAARLLVRDCLAKNYKNC